MGSSTWLFLVILVGFNPPPHLPGCRSDAEQSRQLQPPAAAAATCCTLLLLTAASSGASFVQTWHPMTHCVHVHCPMSTLVTTNYPPTIPLALLDITQYVTDCARHLKWLRSPLEHTAVWLSVVWWPSVIVTPSQLGTRITAAARLLTTAPAGRPPRTEHCLYLQVAAPRPALATSAHRALWPL